MIEPDVIPKVIGICGGSCSGKSTLAEQLWAELGAEQCVILPQDDYFFGHGDAPRGKGGPNFDHPDAIDFDLMAMQLAFLKSGRAIDRPLYAFATHLPKAETAYTQFRVPIALLIPIDEHLSFGLGASFSLNIQRSQSDFETVLETQTQTVPLLILDIQ